MFALLALGGWFGAETHYASGTYFLGMNHPLRFVAFGAALCVSSFLIVRVSRVRSLAQSTLTMGMLYLFIALWILSIFGNYGDLSQGYLSPRAELFHWSLLFGAFAGAAIWHGLRFDNNVSQAFGLAFLFVNIYTRFSEHFWEPLHKGVFFAILGVSLWFLGTRAEQIWNLGREKELTERPEAAVAETDPTDSMKGEAK